MAVTETRFRVDAESIVHETVDGEVIAIDLASGSYFSLAGSGPVIWDLLVAGASAEELRTALEGRYDAAPGEIEEALGELLPKLLESALIAAVEGEGAASAAAPAANGSREAFAPPAFERYTDMKDYFLLDPIHEVDPAGWPKPAG